MSTASSTPAGGWYADPLDASLLRWWDGATWSQQTMPADPALNPSNAEQRPPLAVPPLLTAVPPLDEPYVPPNSVFRMSDTAGGDAYLPEWSGFADISDEVALSGVPVQLALTTTPTEPPIPVSADVFPTLRPESLATPTAKEPVWKVEEPLAAPVNQLFPVASAAAAFPVASVAPVAPVTPVAPVFPVVPVPATPVAAAPVSLRAPISPAQGATLSPHVFPVSAPVPPALVPQPAGEAFPGLVPNAAAAEPVAVAEPLPVAEPVRVAELVQVAEPIAVAEPIQMAEPVAVAEPVEVEATIATPDPVQVAEPEPVAEPAQSAAVVEPVGPVVPPEPAAPLAPASPEPTIYAGPVPTEVGTNPVAPPEFQPFAVSTPGASYVPLAPRPIPQPLQLGTPAAPPTEVAQIAPSAPVEYWPTQGTPPAGASYQPNPGDYVPFDPNAVHLEPVPVIPFSSRDPFNSASTARPDMRAYAAAPVGPSGSTWTGGLAFMLLAPLISTAVFFVWSQLTTTTQLSSGSFDWLPFALGGIGLLGLAAAQIDRSALARRGYFDLASPFWVLLLPPLIYLIIRAVRLRGQGRGAAPAIGLWALSYVAGNILIGVIAVGWLSAPTPERVAFVETTIQHELAAKNITATVTCPGATSFMPGATFGCTVVTPNASLPIRVTVIDWNGDVTVTGAGTTNSGSTSGSNN